MKKINGVNWDERIAQTAVNALKENDTGYYALSDIEKDILEAYRAEVLVRDGSGFHLRAIPDGGFNGGLIYRLPEDFELPEEKAKRWVEYDIYQQGGFYFCGVEHREQTYSPSYLPNIVGFGGVKFEGQRSEEWCMCATQFIGKNGGLRHRSGINSKIATPIKARFEVVA